MSRFLKSFSMMLLIAAGLAGPAQADSDLTVVEAWRLAQAGDVILLDVRTPGEWSETGIAPDARTINVMTDEQAFVEDVLAAVDGDRDRPIAAICRSGNRSRVAQSILEQAGFSSVANVAGGMRDWLTHRQPVVTAP